jgi:hypothetical protein
MTYSVSIPIRRDRGVLFTAAGNEAVFQVGIGLFPGVLKDAKDDLWQATGSLGAWLLGLIEPLGVKFFEFRST